EGQAPRVGQARGVRRHGWPGERVFPVARRPEGIRVEHAGAREHESGDHRCKLERGADHGVPLGLSVGFDGIWESQWMQNASKTPVTVVRTSDTLPDWPERCVAFG